MRYSVLVLLGILTFSVFTLLSRTAIYAEHPAPIIEGTISGGGCRVINGNTVTGTVDAQHTQTIELCQLDDRHLRLIGYPGCTENEGRGKDPSTGKVYIFPTPCDVPTPCGKSPSWGNSSFRFVYNEARLDVKIDGKDFYLITRYKDILCTFELFIPEEKKITIVSQGVVGLTGSIEIFIPQELLSGEFKVLIDGIEAQYSIEKTQGVSKITIKLDFPQNERKIDIVGTQVIPEFPAIGLIIFATAISFMLFTKLMPKSRPSTGNSY